MLDIVIVKSKTINNEAVPVVFRKVETGRVPEEKDERELSRTYIFKNFQTEMPLEMAKVLVKQSPNEFSIIGAKEENIGKETERVVRVAKEKEAGFICEYCKAEAKSKAGLTAHIRYNHPEHWKSKK